MCKRHQVPYQLLLLTHKTYAAYVTFLLTYATGQWSITGTCTPSAYTLVTGVALLACLTQRGEAVCLPRSTQLSHSQSHTLHVTHSAGEGKGMQAADKRDIAVQYSTVQHSTTFSTEQHITWGR